MPTIELTDGTTTYDLTDGAAVSVRANSLNLGNPCRVAGRQPGLPGRRLPAHGPSLPEPQHRHDAGHSGGNPGGGLRPHPQHRADVMEEARRYAIDQVGSRWRLKYNAGSVAAQDVWFNVRNGCVTAASSGVGILYEDGHAGHRRPSDADVRSPR